MQEIGGDGETTFNVPDLTDRVPMGGGTLGATSLGAIPNVTGRVGYADAGGYPVNLGTGATGPFQSYSTGRTEYILSRGSISYTLRGVDMSLSRSSSLYTSTEYIEPSNVRVNYIIRV